ncbi:MAG TPA: hypothetical protein VK206_01615 [Anaerolineales bacterium]|nr:hypothetical protein [Anaerolineales bacterium]HLO32842.1 hypothetical protein [Anaerolineales bacterium]
MSQSQDDDFENRSEEGPPEPYNSWEEYFEDFDCQLEEAPRITVRQRIGNPKIRSVDEVPTSDLEEELNRLIELLYANNIVIDFIHDIDERQAYIFIVEELLDETMDDIRIPDMYSHFIYEDFHPNDEDDIELWTGEFLDAFFKDGPEGDFISIGDQELYDAAGNSIRQEEFKQQIDDFHALYSIITEFKYEIINLNIQGDYSTVEVEIWWAGLNTHEQAIIRNHGISTLQLKRNRDVGWDVIQAKIVGWNN